MQQAREQQSATTAHTASGQGHDATGSTPGNVQLKKAVASAGDFAAQERMLAPVQMAPASGASVQMKAVQGGPALYAVQEKLNLAGFPCGTPDGKMGPATRGAIVAFQRKAGLEPDGICGSQTLAALDAAAANAPAPANTAPGATTAPATDKTPGPATTKPTTPSAPAVGKGETGGGKGGETTPAPTNAKSSEKTDGGDKAASGGEVEVPKGGDWRDTIIANRSGLVSGAKLVPVAGGSPFQFANGLLEKARVEYAGRLGATEPSAPAKEETPGGVGGGATGAVKKTSGDSQAADIQAPVWFNRMQDHMIESADWTTDHQIMQVLVSAYLNAATAAMPANVKAFYDHVGKSELNGQAGDLSYGAGATPKAGQSKADKMKGTSNWCQQASTDAYAQGFHAAGYRFVPRKAGQMHANQLGMKLGETITAQGALASMMALDMPKLLPPKPGEASVKGTHWGVKDCWGAALEPGDLCSFVSSTSGKGTAGHAVTIISAGGGEKRPIRYVSGNAGSQTAYNGSVRVEEATWEPAPAGFDMYSTRPNQRGVVWIYSITKTSKLQPEHVDEQRKALGGAFESTFKMTYDPATDKRGK